MRRKNDGIIPAQLRFRMSRRSNILIAISASLLLLYSGVASAVLRCCHDETPSYQELGLNRIDVEIASYLYGFDADIECVTPAYHIESRAVSSLRFRFDRLIPGVTDQAGDVWVSTAANGRRVSDTWLGSDFKSPPSARFLNMPLYLSLSSLRI